MFRTLFVTLALLSQSAAFAPATTGRMETGLASIGKMQTVRKTIAKIDKSNFSATLSEIEPFLTQEAGASFYKKSMRRIGTKAKVLGVEVPAGYAFEAKANAKRREKQAAYVPPEAAAE